jgi:predicted DNA-binding ribbon-helix-helix protein
VNALSALEKRSMAIAGHRTSLALEPDFWAALEAAAARNKVSLPELIAWIDQTRSESAPDQPLASACRVYALRAGPVAQ